MSLPSAEALSSGIQILFKIRDRLFPVFAREKETVLEAAHRSGVELEGACEGSLACSTCHVVLEKDLYGRLGEPSDRECDLIDQAYKPTGTSRLGCQIKVLKDMEGAVFTIPKATRNFAVDGYRPKPH